LKARVLTALVAIPLVLGAVFYTHPIPFLFLAALTFVAAGWEYGKLSGSLPLSGIIPSGILFATACGLWTFNPQGIRDFIPLTVALVAAIVSIYLRLRQSAVVTVKTPVIVAEWLGWVGAPLIALCLLHGSSPGAWNLHSRVLMLLLPLWAGDTAGIFAGMAFGRHKLAPSISPKKTVEGAIANFVAATMVGYFVAHLVRVPYTIGLTCGAVIGSLGQAGDLFESWVKRKAGSKDSGTLLPGHGGILDRVDSLLFTAIPVAFILAAFGG
jgi:phosphatidate cytidylyltransferase